MEEDARSRSSTSSLSSPATYYKLERSTSEEVKETGAEREKDKQVDDLAKRFGETKMLVPNQIRFGKKTSKR